MPGPDAPRLGVAAPSRINSLPVLHGTAPRGGCVMSEVPS